MKGSIYLRKDGLYQVRLQVNGRRRCAYTRSKAEARDILRRWQHEARLRKAAARALPLEHTLADLLATWLETAQLRESTREHYRFILERHVMRPLGNLELERITPEHIERLYRDLTPHNADHVHRILHRAFAHAVRWRWCDANPLDLVERPRLPRKRRELWTLDQLRAFLNAAHGKPVLVLLAATGMRLGEALALRWGDVAPDVSAVTVRGTAKELRRRVVVNEPKTSAGVRTVTLPAVARAALQALRDRTGDVRPEAFVFESERVRGRPVAQSFVRDLFAATCAAAGVPRIRIHDLRHLHASLLL
ncbi:MAG: tyrosine-type recombinase/integrase, partial [Anaerolineae bacterium]|nr:tyrosine-type recombinase/integrase [Anaerolineae bacterium]